MGTKGTAIRKEAERRPKTQRQPSVGLSRADAGHNESAGSTMISDRFVIDCQHLISNLFSFTINYTRDSTSAVETSRSLIHKTYPINTQDPRNNRFPYPTTAIKFKPNMHPQKNRPSSRGPEANTIKFLFIYSPTFWSTPRNPEPSCSRRRHPRNPPWSGRRDRRR